MLSADDARDDGLGGPVAQSALIVDADAAARAALERELARAGYRVLEAPDSATALALFRAHPADIAFVAMGLPGQDTVETVRHIKSLTADAFVPVVLVHGANGTAGLAEAIDAGGDAIVTTPLDHALLRAKIRALERIRTLHRHSARLRARARDDQEVAQALLEEVVTGQNARSSAMHVDLAASDSFSADIFLAEFCPSGDLNVLLGDFTGHGLAAALAALPTAEVFRSMTAKGFAPQQILIETNRKLHAQLPIGKFLAAIFVRVSRALDRVWVANCGMPDLVLLDADGVRTRVPAAGLPLGIRPELDVAQCLRLVPVTPGQRLLVASDGVHEAFDRHGEQFGRQRIEQTASATPAHAPATPEIKRALDAFRDGQPLADDASLVEIRLVPALFDDQRKPASVPTPACGGTGVSGRWRVSLDLHAEALRMSDPVPMLLTQLQEIPGLAAHRPTLYTVFSELYANALEHGVLRMSSRLKDEPDGFERYAAARERRLEGLKDGWITLSAACVQWPDGGELTIRVQDSGSGFDWQALPERIADGLHGRGLQIVRGLCRTLEFEDAGRCACATYAWGRPGGGELAAYA